MSTNKVSQLVCLSSLSFTFLRLLENGKILCQILDIIQVGVVKYKQVALVGGGLCFTSSEFESLLLRYCMNSAYLWCMQCGINIQVPTQLCTVHTAAYSIEEFIYTPTQVHSYLVSITYIIVYVNSKCYPVGKYVSKDVRNRMCLPQILISSTYWESACIGNVVEVPRKFRGSQIVVSGFFFFFQVIKWSGCKKCIPNNYIWSLNQTEDRGPFIGIDVNFKSSGYSTWKFQAGTTGT